MASSTSRSPAAPRGLTSCARATPISPTFPPAAACGRSSCSRSTPVPRVTDTRGQGRSGRESALLSWVIVALVSTASVSAARADPTQVERGATIYGNYCASCHGEGLLNTSGGVTFDLRRLGPEEHDRFVTAVLDGKNRMPPWRGALRPEQIEA